MSLTANNLIWVDLEMTGLDTHHDYIIEIAIVVTDPELTVLAESPVIAIYQPEQILATMDEWNQTQHRQSGLLERVKNSPYSNRDAERLMLDFLAGLVPARCSPMCGSSICQDRRFMHRLMPVLEAYFHYRNLDVSTIKELAKRWAPSKPAYGKKTTHLALADIHDSIDELKFYRKQLFKI